MDRWGITPDLITFAKGVNSGYVPLGGVVVSAAIRETFAHTRAALAAHGQAVEAKARAAA